jgi:hypothetical protein
MAFTPASITPDLRWGRGRSAAPVSDLVDVVATLDTLTTAGT